MLGWIKEDERQDLVLCRSDIDSSLDLKYNIQRAIAIDKGILLNLTMNILLIISIILFFF